MGVTWITTCIMIHVGSDVSRTPPIYRPSRYPDVLVKLHYSHQTCRKIKGFIHTIMHEKSILTLEYPKIMEKVAKEAAFSASKELVKELQPTPNLEEARRRLAFTTEAYQLIELRNDAGVQAAHDIRPQVVRAALEGV